MSAVERVRETARLMHARADAARPGRWSRIADGVFSPWGSGIKSVAVCVGSHHRDHDRGNAEHIASLDPEVARRIADWLEQAAALIDEAGDGPLAIVAAALTEPAVAVADAYLGDES